MKFWCWSYTKVELSACKTRRHIRTFQRYFYVPPSLVGERRAYPAPPGREALVRSPPTPTHKTCLLSAVGDLKWSLVPFFYSLTQKASRLLCITTFTVNQWILDAVWRASIQGWENIGSQAIMRKKMIFIIHKMEVERPFSYIGQSTSDEKWDKMICCFPKWADTM